MTLLVDTTQEALWTGDILRLPENYDLGPGSLPVDLIVYDPNDEECGLGLLVVSGYKAGLVYALLPAQSLKGGSRALDLDWLRDNWNSWFCYAHEGNTRVMAIDKTRVISWEKRMILETA